MLKTYEDMSDLKLEGFQIWERGRIFRNRGVGKKNEVHVYGWESGKGEDDFIPRRGGAVCQALVARYSRRSDTKLRAEKENGGKGVNLAHVK